MFSMFLVVESPDAVVCALYDFCSIETSPGDAVDHVVVATEDLNNGVFLHEGWASALGALLFDHLAVPYYYTLVFGC